MHGANAHHSLPRAAWLLGLPDPVTVPTPDGILDPAALDEALDRHPGPHLVAAIRRTLLTTGTAVLGRTRAGGRLWLKATLLNPHTHPTDLAALLRLVEGHTPR
ncbi:hypothetical protein GCM10023220_57080 [Streptomyces ziwulingensis]|uniref:Aspartate aminotransferase family protein n=1 Tax=Streptomyces ziwulingensis TaxID=1045501 RepID=A0ABP9CUT1_9ACTN